MKQLSILLVLLMALSFSCSTEEVAQEQPQLEQTISTETSDNVVLERGGTTKKLQCTCGSVQYWIYYDGGREPWVMEYDMDLGSSGAWNTSQYTVPEIVDKCAEWEQNPSNCN